MNSKLRVFYAIPVSPPIARCLNKDLNFYLTHNHTNAIYCTPSVKYHITLNYLGYIHYSFLDNLEDAVKSIFLTAPSFDVTIGKVANFPSKHGKIVAAYVSKQKALLDLHQKIRGVAENIGIAHERRMYKPHITLAKFRSNHYAIEISHKQLIMPVTEIILYESVPSKSGSNYIPLQCYSLNRTL